jgi:hypothetical protein
MNKLVPILTACAMLSACQSAPPPPPRPLTYNTPGRPYGSPRTHHVARKKTPGSGSSPAELATDCPWPAHGRTASATRLETATSRVPVNPAASQQAAPVEGCAVLRFSLSKTGSVNWVDVVSAKPEAVAPLALKCLLAAKFKADAHPDAESMIRVDVKALQPNVVVAELKVR